MKHLQHWIPETGSADSGLGGLDYGAKNSSVDIWAQAGPLVGCQSLDIYATILYSCTSNPVSLSQLTASCNHAVRVFYCNVDIPTVKEVHYSCQKQEAKRREGPPCFLGLEIFTKFLEADWVTLLVTLFTQLLVCPFLARATFGQLKRAKVLNCFRHMMLPFNG